MNIPFLNGFLDTSYIDGGHWYLTTLIGVSFCYSIILRFERKKRYILYFDWLLLYMGLLGMHHYFSGAIWVKLSWHIIGGQQVPIVLTGSGLAFLQNFLKNKKFGGLFLASLVSTLIGLGTTQCVILIVDVLLFVLAIEEHACFLRISPLQFMGKYLTPFM